jgi:hypothetical protein
MKPIEKDELYQNLSGFLKAKGIELKEGSYAHGIQKSCGLLADAINLGQEGLEKAKVGIDRNLDRMRQVIHEKTAPKPASPAPTAAAPAPTPKPSPQAKAKAAKARARKAVKTRKARRSS